jgi:transposase
MARPPMFKAAEKQRIVLSVLRGECSVAEAARRNKCSETSVAKWRDQFLEGGLSALEAGAPRGPSAREAQLERQLAEVTSALGERTSSCACSAATERRVWFRQEQRADDRRAWCFPALRGFEWLASVEDGARSRPAIGPYSSRSETLQAMSRSPAGNDARAAAGRPRALDGQLPIGGQGGGSPPPARHCDPGKRPTGHSNSRRPCFPCAEALREPLCCSSSRRSRVGTANGMAGSEAKTPQPRRCAPVRGLAP